MGGTGTMRVAAFASTAEVEEEGIPPSCPPCTCLRAASRRRSCTAASIQQTLSSKKACEALIETTEGTKPSSWNPVATQTTGVVHGLGRHDYAAVD